MPENEAQVQVIETQRYTKGNKPRDIKGILEAIVVVLVILLLVSLIIPSARSFTVKEEGILTLREAKTVALSIKNYNYVYEAKGASIISKDEENGLTKDAQKEIMTLSSAEGSIQSVKYDENKNELLKLRYQKGDILVIYEKPKSDKQDGWKVYQLKSIIGN